jgi:DNA excision repair protein ERCC-6
MHEFITFKKKDSAFNISNSNMDNTDLDYLSVVDSNENSDVEYTTDDSDNDDDDLDRDKRKKSKNKACIDDGDEMSYEKRIKSLNKIDKAENKTTSYTELDGGLRVPDNIWNRLYKFQKTGVKWLWELNMQRCGGILGDEMGLGKTIQAIVFLAALSFSKLKTVGFPYVGLGPTLIIAPTTLITQWVNEFRNWWSYFRVCVLHDMGSYRKQPRHKLINEVVKANGILLTTYSSLLIYEKHLLAHNWHYVVLDEGSTLVGAKNHARRIFKYHEITM